MKEEQSLPRGWTWTKLGDVVAPSRETVQPANFDGEPFLGMENVEAQTMKILGTVPSSTMKSAGLRFQPQDVLYGRLRPYLNKVVQPDFEGLCSPEFIVFRPEFLDATLLRYFLSSPPFKSFASHLNAGDRPRVDWNQLEVFPFPLAPLEEQKRIATQLDTLFSELDAGLAAIARARAKVKGFRASLLRAATSGELSARWRADNPPLESGAALLRRILDERRAAWEAKERAKRAAKSPAKKLFEDESWKANYLAPKAPDTANLPQLPESWCWASVAQLAALSPNSLSIGPFGSNLKVSDYTTKGVPLVFVRNIRSESFGAAKAKYVLEEKAVELSSHSVESGEILITKMGEPPGDACLYPLDHPKAIITADCIKWKTVAELNASFFVHAINSTVLKRQIEAITKGVAQQKISLDRFRGIATPLPPLAEQEWIVAEVERRLSLVSEVERTLDAALKRAQSLRAAILARAFRGELCEQNPGDESAQSLLERIREARETAPKRGKRASGQGRLF